MSESSNQSPNDLACHKRLLYTLTNWGLFLAGATNLVVGTCSALNGQVDIAATSLTAGLILLFAATIDRFESVKGLGVEAKTRQLDQKIEKADLSLNKLREVAELTGAALIDLNSKAGRWDSAPTTRESYALAQKIRSIMISLDSELPAMQQTLEPWVRIFCFDLGRSIIAPLQTAMNDKLREIEQESAENSEKEISAIAAYLEQLKKTHEFRAVEYPDRLLLLIENAPLIGSDVLEPILAKARQFAPAMIELQEQLQLDNAEEWFIEINRKKS